LPGSWVSVEEKGCPVDAKSSRWHRVTPSTFPWEDEAIDFLRGHIADADPNRGWSNFEFIAGGLISEVDVFLLTRKGAYLIEIKSTPGRLTGDQQRWTFFKPDGGRTTMENPLLGANRKARRIKSLLEHKWRSAAAANATPGPPFIQPLVFLSDPSLQVELSADARMHVCGRDGSPVTEDGSLQGIVAATAQIGAAQAANHHFRQLNTPTAVAVAKALESIGIKESDRTRRVGSWVLRLDTVTERPGIQDFVADHESAKGVTRRVRIYSRQPGMSDEQAHSLRLAAEREFLASERLDHPNVVKAQDRLDTDLGSAVVFPHDPAALRLDHWLAEHADADLYDRLAMLRQLAETLRAVHRRKVTHRALSPGSVLVRPGRHGEPPWVVLVTDFSLAGRGHTDSLSGSSSNGSVGSGGGARRGSRVGTRFGLPTAAPGDVELLADEAALSYQAPELFTDDEPDGASLDVFSFGALAFHVLSGRPPGDSREAVRQVLQSARGLQLSAVVPGVADGLNSLVYEATRPLVCERLSSFDDVLVLLDCAEEEITTPDPVVVEPETPAEIDPLDSKVGDRLGDGSVVTRRLGRGSTALALLVDRGDGIQPREVVYKVALGPDAETRLRDEARILGELSHPGHPGVVELFGETTLAGRHVLVEAEAGTQALSDEIRKRGTPGVEFLQRWGADLLDALRYLERRGRSHRDIKPENLGVTEVGPNKEQHLVLFDFSLAGTPASDLRAGTPPYLDPFLADRATKAWDLAAERYAAAVTLYEMATGETPKWGDGRSDPAFTTTEVDLDTVLFDPAVRDPLEGFFTTALRRDPETRFGNADAMALAWSRVFDALDAAPAAPGDDKDSAGDEQRGPLPEGLALDDPISSLGAAGRVVSALARLEVSTVRQLALAAPVEVNRTRRISPKVRRRIIELRAAVLRRFADELGAPGRLVPAAPTTGTVPSGDTGRPGSTGRRTPARAGDTASPRLDLDALVPQLLPPNDGRARKGNTGAAVRLLLGLDPLPGGLPSGAEPATTVDWASQTAVAGALGVTRGRLGQIAPATRTHWASLAALVTVRDELVDLIAANGGVVAVGELDQLVIDGRGSGLPAAEATLVARAVVRAAVESDELVGDQPGRFLMRRRGDRVLVALDGDGGGDCGDPFDGPALATYAVALGDRADEVLRLAADVIPQDRAVAVLRAIPAPDGVLLADGRLVRLAAAASQLGGVSAALELYPRALAPLRAVRLTRQGLAAAAVLTEANVRSRVYARFPLVALPPRPQLDQLLTEAEVAVTWDPERGIEGAYVRRATAVGGVSSLTSIVERASTRTAGRPPHRRAPVADTDPVVAAAAELEGRLERSLDHGGFLALRVPTNKHHELRRELARFTGGPHHVVPVDLEAVFLDELRAEAAAKRVSWEKLTSADVAAAGTTDHTNLRLLTAQAALRTEQHVLGAGSRVVAWNPGILKRYDETLTVIHRLRATAGRGDAALQTLWLIVFGSTAEARPSIDGAAVPVSGPSEWLDITEAWLANRHRHLGPTGTEAPASGGALR
jgi:serine/threonine protein kinase